MAHLLNEKYCKFIYFKELSKEIKMAKQRISDYIMVHLLDFFDFFPVAFFFFLLEL